MKRFLQATFIFYLPRYPRVLVYMLQGTTYQPGPYLKQYWTTQDFSSVMKDRQLTQTKAAQRLVILLQLGMLVEVFAGLFLLYLWHWHNLSGGLEFGLALIIAYPIVWAHLLAFAVFLRKEVPSPKKIGKNLLCSVLEGQVKQLRRRNDFKIIAVVGSVGKTSTKLAIAKTLSSAYSTVYQEGNYNDRLTVPLVLFEHTLPNLIDLPAWIKIIAANYRMIRRSYPYHYAVLELGTDGPGQLAAFSYLQPDITVVTAVTPEHMEYFGTLDAVAAEELSVFDYSKEVLINRDDTPIKYLKEKSYLSYGIDIKTANYLVSSFRPHGLEPADITIQLPDKTQLKTKCAIAGKPGAKIELAAAATAHLLGIPNDKILEGLATVLPFAGRMQILEGIRSSTIIDDTYNASPAAVKAALDVLYATKGTQRIAILGNMNELGDYSIEAHKEVGAYCNPKKLALVVTIGPDANRYLAPAARNADCEVKSFSNPRDAGDFVKQQLITGAIVLAEGSQNGVFAEEAVKVLLRNTDDQAKLVRQSDYWLHVKERQFLKT